VEQTWSSAILFSWASSPPSDKGSAATNASNCAKNNQELVAPSCATQLLKCTQEMDRKPTAGHLKSKSHGAKKQTVLDSHILVLIT